MIAAYETTECFMALYVSIFKEVPPERAFQLLSDSLSIRKNNNSSYITEEDIEDMIKFREEGIFFKDIGEFYGISMNAVRRRIERYKDKFKRDEFKEEILIQ